MAPPTTVKTPSKGSKKMITKKSKGIVGSSKSGATADKKTNKRKRKLLSLVLKRLLTIWLQVKKHFQFISTKF